MSRSIGIVLGASGVSFASEWIQTDMPNYRIPVAGLGAALFTAGIERLNPTLGVGLAYMMFVTVMVTPFNGKAPLEVLGDVAAGKPMSDVNKLGKKVVHRG